ncbi:MAG TPA: hypothetical protein VG405_08125 [Solirubrobacteraceae bacterium]|jgi:hypothetical protein|nr:hypothetical protein [Solirubrobacteraceae bacterium]
MENTLNTPPKKFRRISRRIRQVASDISYLERRKLELRTGVPMFGPDPR